MKKIAFSFLIAIFAVTSLGNTVFASSKTAEPSKEILAEVEAIANSSDSLELFDVDELPKGTPMINFDTVEDFEKPVKEFEAQAQNDNEYAVTEETTP